MKRGTRALPFEMIKLKMQKSKRSQAFLITAVIFIAIISAFIATHNFSKRTEFSTFPFIAGEIQIESEKVMDYSLIKDDWDKINDFTKDVSDYAKKEEIDIYFVNDNGCYNYVNGAQIQINNCNIDGTTYDFYKYPEGKHFYFIMIKEKEVGGEKYVYTNA